ncbi:LIM and calponin domains-containing protein 1 [Caerostris extrusa]|uniref:LIM and calponin domains-containing protein 1 n=1 Tax=Caerostris extrusa TaxID=172846 RepID=A0AAV4QYN7_CAEEX|nr:LIM and calponin domains-containing protein 1 [Caerostris extrusa]
MPGSTTIFGPAAENNEIVHKTPEATIMSAKQPPPVAPRTTSVSIQSWQMATSGDTNYSENHHARSASMDSLESSGSSSSGSIAHQNSTTIEYIPTRIVGKTPKLPSHNPLQFVKVQSPLCRKVSICFILGNSFSCLSTLFFLTRIG